MSKPSILHFLTPLTYISPFDVNMAADAGFVIASYTQVTNDLVVRLTQDAMFSRDPKNAPRTCLFFGGADGLLALDWQEAARKELLPPFEISLFSDPNGAFTTAGAMVAAAERQLKKQGGSWKGAKVTVYGAKGVVAGICGVICAEQGAEVTLVTHDRSNTVAEKAVEFEKRFQRPFKAAFGSNAEERTEALKDADVVFTAARAGVQVLSKAELAHAKNLKVAADVNAVPPLGIEGVGVHDDGVAVPGTNAVGIGALAIGDIKFKAQHALLHKIAKAEKAQFFDFRDAYREALEIIS